MAENAEMVEPVPEPHRVFPEAKKKKGGCPGCLFGCFAAFVAILILLLAGAWLIGNFLSNFADDQESEDDTEESVLRPASERGGKIAVIDIRGIILNAGGGFSENADSETICRQIRKAAKDPLVRAIILNLNTPGGEVTASDDIYSAVLRAKKSKPVIALMNSMAASGGYYAAAGCDWIIANRMTLTGSVGVIISSFDVKGLLDKIGVQADVYKSGKMKDLLSVTRGKTQEENALIQSLVDECYIEFVKIVSAGRKIPVEKIRATEIGDGRVFHGARALELGLIDELGRMPEAVAKAEELAKCEPGSLKVVRYKRNNSLFNLLFSADAEASHLLRVRLPGFAAPELQQGCLYFLPQDYLR